jgi:hypothetical protein
LGYSPSLPQNQGVSKTGQGALSPESPWAKTEGFTLMHWEDLEAGIGIEPIYMDLQSSA